MSDATTPPQSPLKAAIVRVTPFEQNCTLIWNEASKRGAVVDPGGDLDRIFRGIDEAEIEIEKILLTHGHIDHAGAADELATLKERARDIILGAIRLKVNSDRGFTLTGKNESDSLTFRRDPTVWGND